MSEETPENIAWQIETVRLTSIFAQPQPITDWFKTTVGFDADESTRQVPIGFSQESKVVEGFRLSLIQLPGRADWVLTLPSNGSGQDPRPLPSIGSFEKAAEALKSLVTTKWLKTSPPLSRLAFAGSAHAEDSGTNFSANFLQGLIQGFQIGEPSDFSLQVNRPICSVAIPGLTINRMTRWSLSQQMLIQFAPTSVVTINRDRPFARVDFDLNNRPDQNCVIDASNGETFFVELLSNAGDLLSKGLALE